MTAPVVLAVCLGNICRSPTAEAAIREAAVERGVDVEVRSAGTGSWHVGSPPDPRMRAAARQAGLEIDGRAEHVTADAIADADLVLAMDRANLADLEGLAAAAGLTTPIRLFREFDPEGGPGHDVPDPYHGPDDGFSTVVDICRRTARALVSDLDATLGRPDDRGRHSR